MNRSDLGPHGHHWSWEDKVARSPGLCGIGQDRERLCQEGREQGTPEQSREASCVHQGRAWGILIWPHSPYMSLSGRGGSSKKHLAQPSWEPMLHSGPQLGLCSILHAPPAPRHEPSGGLILESASSHSAFEVKETPSPPLLPAAQDSLTPLPARAPSLLRTPGSACDSLDPGMRAWPLLCVCPSLTGQSLAGQKHREPPFLCCVLFPQCPWAHLLTQVKACSQERSIHCSDGNVPCLIHWCRSPHSDSVLRVYTMLPWGETGLQVHRTSAVFPSLSFSFFPPPTSLLFFFLFFGGENRHQVLLKCTALCSVLAMQS